METKNIVDFYQEKKRKVEDETPIPFSFLLLLYLFDINEMVKSSVKNSINLFWLTSSFFLLSFYYLFLFN